MNKAEKEALKKERLVEKQQKAEQKKRDKELEKTSKTVKKHTKKEIIITTIITIVLVAVLVTLSSVLARFVPTSLDAEQIYDYKALEEYFTENGVQFEYKETTTEEYSQLKKSGVIGVATINNELHIYYFSDVKKLNSFGSDLDKKGKDQKYARTESATTAFYYLETGCTQENSGTENYSETYKKYFKDLLG